MSTAIFETKPVSSIHLERACACPFSIATDYAIDYLTEAEAGGTRGAKARMSFGLAIDIAEAGRKHDEIRLRWKSGSPLFPNFHATIRFRIAGTHTMVVIDGAYAGPLGTIGTWYDRLVGRWISTRTLDDLTCRVCLDLERREREWRTAHAPAVA